MIKWVTIIAVILVLLAMGWAVALLLNTIMLGGVCNGC